MIPDNSPWQPVAAAQIEWGEEGTPFSTTFQDYYYNSDNGLQETQYVFLEGAQLPARWSEHTTDVFCIGETGFGTGLNFLATWRAWDAQPDPKPDLHYIAIEKHPLNPADLERALQHWPALHIYAEQLLDGYPGLVPGQHRLLFADGRVHLDLWWHDATQALQDIGQRSPAAIDAWYLDGFSPSRNQAMWELPLFQALKRLSRPGATLASFTAAGQVRRALADAGFDITKRTGFGLKRECISGIFQQGSLPEQRNEDTASTCSPNTLTPWDLSKSRPVRPRSALIVGAGLAGATTAAALARRGIEVTVIDAGNAAGGASANAQGVLYTRLSRQHSNLVDFALQSFLFATQFYRGLFSMHKLRASTDGELCGSFAQINNTEDLQIMMEALSGVPHLAQVLSANDANQYLGVVQDKPGYWYPQSGWLNPPAVCHALLQHPQIQLIENTGPATLEQRDNGWAATARDTELATADAAVLASGTGTINFEALSWLPLQSIRGQTTHIGATTQSQKLNTVLCHSGYIAPARNGEHCIGASFGPGDSETGERPSEHTGNIAALEKAIPHLAHDLAAISNSTLSGKVRFRCASNDYLPVVGQVPDIHKFCHSFAALRKDARQHVPNSGDYLPGLFVSTAHGSRGLTSTPLAAEQLASVMCNEPSPLSRKLTRAISPARFIIRDLSRNRL